MESLSYQEFGAGALAPYAECFWHGRASATAAPHPIPPDGCMDIVFWREGGLRVIGTMTTQQNSELPPNADLVGLRFRPGMAGFFLGTVAPELVDRWTPLEDLWGARGRRLHRALEDSPTAAARFLMLSQALGEPSRGFDSVHRAISAIVAAGGAVDLDWVASQSRLSPRQFRRRSIEETGLAPKRLCRVLRFRRASLVRGRMSWAEVAAECGYSDQAHLIRDFREFTGAPPCGTSRDRFVQDPGPASGLTSVHETHSGSGC